MVAMCRVNTFKQTYLDPLSYQRAPQLSPLRHKPYNPSKMDLFAILDNALFAQDPYTSLELFSTETTTTTTTTYSSLPPQSDIPVDEDRSGSGGFTGFCVIS